MLLAKLITSKDLSSTFLLHITDRGNLYLWAQLGGMAGYGPNRVAGCGIAKAYFGPSIHVEWISDLLGAFLLFQRKIHIEGQRGVDIK